MRLFFLAMLFAASSYADPLGYRTNGLRFKSTYASRLSVCNTSDPCLWWKDDGRLHASYGAVTDLDLFAAPSSLTISATVGTLNFGSITTDATDINFFRYSPTDSLASKWYAWVGQFNGGCAGGGTFNHVYRMGWNAGGGGDRAEIGTNKAMISDAWEQAYSGTVGNCQIERYIEFRDASGTLARPLFLAADVTDAHNKVLDFRAETITMGPGLVVGDSSGLSIGTTETSTRSPDGFKRVRLTNDSLFLEAGTTNSPAATLELDATGDASMRGARGFIGTGSVTWATWTSGGLCLQDSISQNQFACVTPSDIQIGAGGALNLRLFGNRTEVRVPIQPQTDQTQTTVGAPSLRFTLGYFGAPVANQPTCDEPHRGGIMTVFADASAADTLQVCMKAAADTYAWRTVYTAP